MPICYKPVAFSFPQTITEQEAIEAQDCVVWDYDEKTGEGFWTKDGCERISDDNSAQTTCSCNKLGSFAILIVSNIIKVFALFRTIPW